MAEYGETPFPGDYRPGQVEASPGFLSGNFDTASLPHFSPANSEHSFSVGLDPSRPATSTGVPTNTGTPMGGDLPIGAQAPGSAPVTFQSHHHHTNSGHSHSFSTASLPSLASSSTSFSMASQAEPAHPGGPIYAPFVPAEYAPSPMFHHDPKALAMGGVPGQPPGTFNPGMGFGVSYRPPPPMPGTLPPALLGRSPVAGPTGMIPTQAFPGSGPMGKMAHERNRSASRPSPYHVQSSRSNSLSVKSDVDEELMSIYSSTSNQSGYNTSWSNSTGIIAGDMSQMSLEHRRSSSTPFEIPSMGHHAGRTRARSFSLGKTSNNLEFLESELEFNGNSAAERETVVRADLGTKADQVRALSPCQHGKARAVWAKRWLKLSYTPVNGFTVPRQGLYHSYTMSCNDFGLRPINSASFGKVVRSTFLGIRTRRLGVRGNSKYHYVSLRPAIQTEAHRLNAYGDSSGQLHIAPQDGDMIGDDQGDQEILTEDDTDEDGEDDELADLSEGMGYSVHPFSSQGRSRSRSHDDMGAMIRSARPATIRRTGVSANAVSGTSSGASTAMRQSSPVAGRALPLFPALPANADPAAQHFWGRFCANQELLCRCAAELSLDRFEANYRSFWETLSAETRAQCAKQPVAGMIVDVCMATFDYVILSLVDKILVSITSHAHAAIGVLATSFEKITAEALAGYPPEVARPLMEVSVHVGQLFARFLDLHQITTAIVPILADPDQLAAMRASWRMLDIGFIVRQCITAGDCAESVIDPAVATFGAWLNDVGNDPLANPVELLAGCVDGTLLRAESGLPASASLKILIARAAFITSQVMRLLTLRSDLSFGWFQLIKTWIDDYVTISCTRRAAFARPGGDEPASAPAPAPAPLFPSMSMEMGGGHPNPHLAIDTASAGYGAFIPLDQNAITPRPAFTNAGAVTSASGPGVGGMAGAQGVASVAGAAGAPGFM